MFSIIAKTNKGRRYFYLREQRRIGDKVRPKDFYLGRMDGKGVPWWVRLHALVRRPQIEYFFADVDEGTAAARKLQREFDETLRQWTSGFDFEGETVADALDWWRRIDALRVKMGRKWRCKRPMFSAFMGGYAMEADATEAQKRWFSEAFSKVGRLEEAIQSNRDAAPSKALSFARK